MKWNDTVLDETGNLKNNRIDKRNQENKHNAARLFVDICGAFQVHIPSIQPSSRPHIRQQVWLSKLGLKNWDLTYFARSSGLHGRANEGEKRSLFILKYANMSRKVFGSLFKNMLPPLS